MADIVLYRKYRPQSFKEVLGQEHIVDVLSSSLKQNRISHAYLFSGPRGTGKTSIARILAKEIGSSGLDLVEIDAASSRGIDEIRALRDAVRLFPLQSKYKVYVIDEVHMLTKEAFNALLKTLEEPPEHAIFVLATTEFEKIPETVVSRCQQFSFRKLPESILRKALLNIADKEKIKIDGEALALLAFFADGSFRDAIGFLDQVAGLGKEKIGEEEIRKIFSAPKRELVEEIISSIVERAGDKGFKAIKNAVEANIDINLFLKFILRDVRGLLLLNVAPEMEKDLRASLTEREMNFLLKHKNILKPNELERALTILLDAHQMRANSYLPELPLELALVKIIHN
jgi:DNA polymerase-3 subunit gamma/tau